MKHQELLDKLAYTPHTDPNGKYMYRALRAVVELHKPDGNSNCAYCNKRFACKKCGSRLESYISYPCPTIQAIEKELK